MAAAGQRVAAWCIDAAIYVPIALLAILSMSASYPGTAILVAEVCVNVFAWLYVCLLIGLSGATVGNRAMQIKVVDQASGNTIGLGRAFSRRLIIHGVAELFLLAFNLEGFAPPLLFIFVGYLVVFVVLLSPLFDNSGRLQGWHDKVAKDVVIKV